MRTTPPPENHSVARPFASFQLRADLRLFHTSRPVPCREGPELFFDPRQKRRAVARCAECPFRGRCGYNAVAAGVTHGIWGGVILPGTTPSNSEASTPGSPNSSNSAATPPRLHDLRDRRAA